MKKIIVFLLTAVLCLATLSVGMAAGDYVREGEHGVLYEIEKFTPVIDGELDPEYLYSKEVTLKDNGPDFAQASIYYLWDDNALYFHVRVYDKTPDDGEGAIDHNSDCIEMLFSLFNYDTTTDMIKSKQPTDPGDAQFRVFRTKDLSYGETIVDNGIKYQDGSHGGFGKWVYDNTDIEDHDPVNDATHIIHTNDDDGYYFEGFVKWSPDLKNGFTDGEGNAVPATIKTGAIIGLGIQVNDDINADSVRDLKCYGNNCGPAPTPEDPNGGWSMSGNRATCGMFQLVDNGITVDPPETTEAPTTEAPETPEAPTTEAPETEAPTTEAPATEAPETEAPETEAPETADPSVIFALLTVVSAGGFTVFAAKKAKKD